MRLTRRELLALIPAAMRAQTAFGLPVNTRPKYVFSVGQSLSNGGAGNPAISAHDATTTNRMFNDGVVWDDETVSSPTRIASLVDLAEGIGTINSGGSLNTRETHCSGFANQISAWARANGMGAYHDTIQDSWGVGGKAYVDLKKGTVPYSNSIAAVTRAKVLLPTVIVPATLCIHGETDGSCGYYAKVQEWQSDYQTDIQAITGQSGLIPMFMSQVQQQECGSGGTVGQPTYTGMLGAFEQTPTLTVLCNPKYMFPYVAAGTHLTNAGYRWMGEYYAKAYWKQIVLGQQWSPLRPLTVSTASNVITVQMTGFVPPLVFDTVNVSDPGNYGFAYTGGGGGTISSVAITDATAGIIQITLTAPATGGGLSVDYAIGTSTPHGPTAGARGCLRDSDPLVSLSGNPLQNWCVHFCKKLTYP